MNANLVVTIEEHLEKRQKEELLKALPSTSGSYREVKEVHNLFCANLLSPLVRRQWMEKIGVDPKKDCEAAWRIIRFRNIFTWCVLGFVAPVFVFPMIGGIFFPISQSFYSKVLLHWGIASTILFGFTMWFVNRPSEPIRRVSKFKALLDEIEKYFNFVKPNSLLVTCNRRLVEMAKSILWYEEDLRKFSAMESWDMVHDQSLARRSAQQKLRQAFMLASDFGLTSWGSLRAIFDAARSELDSFPR